ncbi:transcription factor bHLH162-like, partial [Morus notabilis]
EVISLPDQLDEAATYIKKLQVSLEKMKEKKNSLKGIEKSTGNYFNNDVGMGSQKWPQIEVHEKGPALEVVLITGLDCQFMFNETIRVLHEEGADIVNASFSVVNEDTVYHTIHCKIGELDPSSGAAKISERLKKFVDETNAS